MCRNDAKICLMSEDLSSSESWINHMRRGEFELAWQFSDKILKSDINRNYEHLPRHYQCIWDGTPLNGKRVLIRCYHGLGDTLQFIRYAELVKEIASEVIVWAQPELLQLLQSVKGIDKLLPLHNGSPEVNFDVDVEIMELPHIFRTILSSIPIRIPYLRAEPMLLPGSALKVGLVWQAGNWDQSRNVPFSVLKPLFEIPDIDFFILQANAESAGWERGYGIYRGDFNLNAYASFVKGLDFLISVDSMPAHLAGALNVPVWLMIQEHADWRWMENREDSPWYPSMKLFRQQKQGDWQGVADKITKNLRLLQLKTIR